MLRSAGSHLAHRATACGVAGGSARQLAGCASERSAGSLAGADRGCRYRTLPAAWERGLRQLAACGLTADETPSGRRAHRSTNGRSTSSRPHNWPTLRMFAQDIDEALRAAASACAPASARLPAPAAMDCTETGAGINPCRRHSKPSGNRPPALDGPPPRQTDAGRDARGRRLRAQACRRPWAYQPLSWSMTRPRRTDVVRGNGGQHGAPDAAS